MNCEPKEAASSQYLLTQWAALAGTNPLSTAAPRFFFSTSHHTSSQLAFYCEFWILPIRKTKALPAYLSLPVSSVGVSFCLYDSQH
jgi:hypothetical protein